MIIVAARATAMAAAVVVAAVVAAAVAAVVAAVAAAVAAAVVAAVVAAVAVVPQKPLMFSALLRHFAARVAFLSDTAMTASLPMSVSWSSHRICSLERGCPKSVMLIAR
jgi:hypothetical protein